MPSPRKENILIADDDKIIVDLFRFVLERDGHINVAGNGVEALAIIKEKYCKLIICDVHMPLMDGLSFYHECVKRFPNITKRFLFTTGSLSSERRNFFEEHDLQYFYKPLDVNKFKETSRKIISS